MKFTANISRFEESKVFWTSIIIIPDAVYKEMIKISPDKRIICTINNSITFHCAMIPKKPFHYIMLSKDKIKTLKLNVNDIISVEIVADTSEFGMEICEELQEVLASDDEGNLWFQKLTPGKKRSLLYMLSKTKNSQLKIKKSFVFIEHLKRNKGEFDPIIYQEEYKNFRDKNSI
ncbi:YdeI/OmpD-associated family protein [Flavobacterium sp.]|uniref:YdeI/OmpD-associated family protein n=1 Tax=Flavobacterium sp. TaxID=239 RepID=UPI00286D9F93|nr:YdeI/OmpD-associated family protein [Flavobacterium sp.]